MEPVKNKTYRYEGFNANAAVKCGLVEAPSEAEAASALRDMGLFVQKIELNSDSPMRTVLPGAAEQAEFLNQDKVTPKVSSRESPKESHPKETKEAYLAKIGEFLKEDLAKIGEFYKICIANLGLYSDTDSDSDTLAQDVLRSELNIAVKGMVQSAYQDAFKDFVYGPK